MAYVLEECRTVRISTTIDWDSQGASFEPLRFPSPKAYEFLEMIIYVHEGIFTLMNKALNEDFSEECSKLGKAFHSDM